MSYKKEAYLKNLDWMTTELFKIASNKDLSLTEELKQIKNLKQEYLKNKAELETEAKSKCAVCGAIFDKWDDYNTHRLEHKPDLVKGPLSIKNSSKINVFNRDWNVTPVEKEGSYYYDVHDSDGKKVMSLKPATGKEWSTAELQAALKNELTHGFKQAKLTKKIAFLNEGDKVILLSTSKDKKQTKFASIQHGVRGWTSTSNLKVLALDGQSVAHEGHQDKVLAIHETETLVECPTMGVHWKKKDSKLSTHDKPTSQPPATPESLNDVESEVKCPKCKGEGRPGCGSCPECGGYASEMKERKESSKDCPDCHGNFAGKENEKCPTCGRFSVMALKTALPPTIPNQRGYLDNPPPVDKTSDYDVKCVCDGKKQDCKYCHGTGKITFTGSLNKSAHIRHENGKWVIYSHDFKKKLGTYDSKEAATKRLREIEYFKSHKGSQKPFSKKASEVLTDPYQALHTQVQTLRDRMSLVQERLQSNPLPKEGGEGEKDNSEMDIPSLLEDLTMGIDLLETKLQGDKVEQDVHPAIEEMENLLWSVEEKLGITPKLSEEEKSEPEHKDIVEEVKKEAAPIPTDSLTSPVTPAPLPQDIRPTDEDNLESPVQMPKSPLPPGQKWVFDSVNKKYIAMTDPMASPGKTI